MRLFVADGDRGLKAGAVALQGAARREPAWLDLQADCHSTAMVAAGLLWPAALTATEMVSPAVTPDGTTAFT